MGVALISLTELSEGVGEEGVVVLQLEVVLEVDEEEGGGVQ